MQARQKRLSDKDASKTHTHILAHTIKIIMTLMVYVIMLPWISISAVSRSGLKQSIHYWVDTSTATYTSLTFVHADPFQTRANSCRRTLNSEIIFIHIAA